MKKAVIVVPTYNEVKNIETLLSQVFAVTRRIDNWDTHVLIVDSRSPDKTADLVRKLKKTYPKLHLLEDEKNGLGKAYTKGFTYALKHLKPTVVFEMDADLSHEPGVIPQFLKKIEEGADFVIGSRYIKGGAIPSDWGLHRKVFSVLGNIVIRLGFMKLSVSDWTSGYRAIKVWIIKDALSHISRYSGYVFQVALLDFALKRRAQIKEVPIVFTDRRHGKSKINSMQYIIHTLFYTFFHSSFIRYVLVGLMGFGIDFGLSYFFIEKLHTALWIATLISAETAIISNFIFNNYWSFSHKQLEARASTFAAQFFKFNLISSGSLVIQATGMELLAFFFGRKWWFVYKIFIIAFIVIPYSYILYNRVVWKEK